MEKVTSNEQAYDGITNFEYFEEAIFLNLNILEKKHFFLFK